MKFRMLQENLRKTLWEYIDAGELTGLRLAEQTGFKQAHISNFLNRKRGLSLEGMDRVLNVQHLSVLDLIDPAEVNKRASILPPGEDEFENVAVADPHIAVCAFRLGPRMDLRYRACRSCRAVGIGVRLNAVAVWIGGGACRQGSGTSRGLSSERPQQIVRPMSD